MQFKPTHTAVMVTALTQDPNARQVVFQRMERHDGEIFFKKTVPSDVNGQPVESFIPEKRIRLLLGEDIVERLVEFPVHIDFDGNKVEAEE